MLSTISVFILLLQFILKLKIIAVLFKLQANYCIQTVF